jgi:hypothetical protein
VLILVHKSHTLKLAGLCPEKQVRMFHERWKDTEEVAKRLLQIRTTFV